VTFREDPSVDYGGLVQRVPAEVVRPASIDELATAIARLAAAGTPWKLRGAGHTATGETLTDRAVVDLRGLAGIVHDDPEREEITVLAGTRWLAVWEHLAPQRRRPIALTTHLLVTVGGTLAVGGVGDSSHLYGPQIAHVRRAVLVTPDGARHSLAAGDPLLGHALAGHGQLGALAEVTLATRRAPITVTGRVYRWGALDALLEDLAVLTHDYVRARVVWAEGMVRAWAIVADSNTPDLPPPRHWIAQSHVETVDLLAHSRIDPSPGWAPFNPCLEVVVPYPSGMGALRRMDTALAHGPLVRYLPRGSSMQIVAGAPHLPLSPFRGEREVVLVIRPEVPTREQALACETPLRELAAEGFAAGGRVYLTSFALDAPQLVTQLGAAAGTLAALKRQYDPGGLCNLGSLHGWQRGEETT
jgi:hypothetical protein